MGDSITAAHWKGRILVKDSLCSSALVHEVGHYEGLEDSSATFNIMKLQCSSSNHRIDSNQKPELENTSPSYPAQAARSVGSRSSSQTLTSKKGSGFGVVEPIPVIGNLDSLCIGS